MPLTPEDLDNIQMRTKLHSLEMKDDIVKAMQESFEKHLETNHVPIQEDMRIVEGANRSEALEYQRQGELLCESILQRLRDLSQLPVYVGSGFRGTTLNSKVGGSKYSQHMSFQAADINLKGLLSWDGRLILLGIIWGLEMAGKLSFGQLLVERGCVHISLPRGNGRDGEVAYYDVATKKKIIIRGGK